MHTIQVQTDKTSERRSADAVGAVLHRQPKAAPSTLPLASSLTPYRPEVCFRSRQLFGWIAFKLIAKGCAVHAAARKPAHGSEKNIK